MKIFGSPPNKNKYKKIASGKYHIGVLAGGPTYQTFSIPLGISFTPTILIAIPVYLSGTYQLSGTVNQCTVRLKGFDGFANNEASGSTYTNSMITANCDYSAGNFTGYLYWGASLNATDCYIEWIALG